MNAKRVLNYNFFFISIFFLINSFVYYKNSCMKNKYSRIISSSIRSRLLLSNINNNSSHILNFSSLFYDLRLLSFISFDIFHKNSIFQSISKSIKPNSYKIQKKLMSEETSSTSQGLKKREGTSDHCTPQDKKMKVESEYEETSKLDEVETKAENSDDKSEDKVDKPKVIYRGDYKPHGFGITKTELDIDIYDDHTTVKSTLYVNKSGHYKGEDLVLDGIDIEIKNLYIDDLLLKENEHYTYDNEFLTIYSQFLPREDFKFSADVVIHPETNYALSGLYKSKDIYVSQCEATGFRHITFYIDRPDIMSKFFVKLGADKQKFPVLLSNGNKVQEYDLDGGRHKAEFVDPHPKPCYLFAVVAGDLKYLTEKYVTKFSKRTVELYVYSEEKYVSKLSWALESLKKAMKFDEDYFGLEYDLDRLNLVAVSDFNVGAMENKGLNVFNADSLLVSKKTSIDFYFERILTVVGHEYFHNYTGNRVTLRDWFQLTLKEGLTVHRENVFSEQTIKSARIRLDNINILRSVQFLEDSSPISHPIRPDSYVSMDNFYTTTVYNKGCEVMRMYHTLLGDEYYKKGITMYLKTNDGKTATCEDFNEAMNKAYQLKKNDNNVNLDQYLLWFSQSGTPHVTATYKYDENKKRYSITLTQHTKPDERQKEKKALLIPVTVGLIDPANGKEIYPSTTLELRKNKQTFTFENVDVKPIPSLFRGLSAPVYIVDNLTDEERITLIKYDTDPFVRYNACTDIYMKQILNNYKELLEAKTEGTEVKLTPVNKDFINAIKYLLNDPKVDTGFKAYMIALPSDKYVFNFLKHVDTDLLYEVKDFIREDIGKELNDIFYDIFLNLKDKADDLTHFENEAYVDFDQINLRTLRNILLKLLSKYKYKDMSTHILEHFKSPYPSNWLTSFSASAYYDIFNDLYEQAYERSKNDELLLQQWLKAASGADRDDIYDIIKKLKNDVLKDSKNPNIIRSVYLPFTASTKHFNHISGKGYKLLADVIIEVDKFNPTVATQLCGSFKIWNKLNEPRQKLILEEIDRIINREDISKNLQEYLLRLTNKL